MIATQNPIELEGTYPLPEAQLDRFLMRIPMGYPDRRAEIAILETMGAGQRRAEDLEPVTTSEQVAAATAAISHVHVAPALAEYIVDLVGATRDRTDLLLGVSPRGALALQRAARALAASTRAARWSASAPRVLTPRSRSGWRRDASANPTM